MDEEPPDTIIIEDDSDVDPLTDTLNSVVESFGTEKRTICHADKPVKVKKKASSHTRSKTKCICPHCGSVVGIFYARTHHNKFHRDISFAPYLVIPELSLELDPNIYGALNLQTSVSCELKCNLCASTFPTAVQYEEHIKYEHSSVSVSYDESAMSCPRCLLLVSIKDWDSHSSTCAASLAPTAVITTTGISTDIGYSNIATSSQILPGSSTATATTSSSSPTFCECDYCYHQFVSQQHLNKHIYAKHSSKCPYCGFDVERRTLLSHLKRCLSRPDVSEADWNRLRYDCAAGKCSLCSLPLAGGNRVDTLNHILLHTMNTRGNTIFCTICYCSYKSFDALFNHLDSHSIADTNKTEDSFTCQICLKNVICDFPGALQLHYVLVHEIHLTQKEVPGIAHSTEKKVTGIAHSTGKEVTGFAHSTGKEVTGVGRFSTWFDSMNRKDSPTLHRAAASSSGEVSQVSRSFQNLKSHRFKCNYCDADFSKEKKLAKHKKRMHCLECPHCQQLLDLFSVPSHMVGCTQRPNYATGEKCSTITTGSMERRICSICSASLQAYRRIDLVRHMIKHIRHQPKSITLCTICYSSFVSFQSFLDHLRTHAVPDDRANAGSSMAGSSSVSQSLTTHETVDLEECIPCSQCELVFGGSDTLRTHFLLIHPENDSERLNSYINLQELRITKLRKQKYELDLVKQKMEEQQRMFSEQLEEQSRLVQQKLDAFDRQMQPLLQSSGRGIQASNIPPPGEQMESVLTMNRKKMFAVATGPRTDLTAPKESCYQEGSSPADKTRMRCRICSATFHNDTTFVKHVQHEHPEDLMSRTNRTTITTVKVEPMETDPENVDVEMMSSYQGSSEHSHIQVLSRSVDLNTAATLHMTPQHTYQKSRTELERSEKLQTQPGTKEGQISARKEIGCTSPTSNVSRNTGISGQRNELMTSVGSDGNVDHLKSMFEIPPIPNLPRAKARTCPVCDKKFGSDEYANGHIISEHAQTILGKRVRLPCPGCDTVFTNPQSLYAHMGYLHSTEEEMQLKAKRVWEQMLEEFGVIMGNHSEPDVFDNQNDERSGNGEANTETGYKSGENDSNSATRFIKLEPVELPEMEDGAFGNLGSSSSAARSPGKTPRYSVTKNKTISRSKPENSGLTGSYGSADVTRGESSTSGRREGIQRRNEASALSSNVSRTSVSSGSVYVRDCNIKLTDVVKSPEKSTLQPKIQLGAVKAQIAQNKVKKWRGKLSAQPETLVKSREEALPSLFYLPSIPNLPRANGNDCPVCRKHFRCEEFVNDHIVSEHTEKFLGKRLILQCPGCDATFKSPRVLHTHLNILHENNQNLQIDASTAWYRWLRDIGASVDGPSITARIGQKPSQKDMSTTGKYTDQDDVDTYTDEDDVDTYTDGDDIDTSTDGEDVDEYTDRDVDDEEDDADEVYVAENEVNNDVIDLNIHTTETSTLGSHTSSIRGSPQTNARRSPKTSRRGSPEKGHKGSSESIARSKNKFSPFKSIDEIASSKMMLLKPCSVVLEDCSPRVSRTTVNKSIIEQNKIAPKKTLPSMESSSLEWKTVGIDALSQSVQERRDRMQMHREEMKKAKKKKVPTATLR